MEHQDTCSSDAVHQQGECIHPLNAMGYQEFPDPDYAQTKFVPPPPDIVVADNDRPVHADHWIAPLGADVPYAFTIGAVTFIGVLYIRGKQGVDTYTRGAVGGVLNCTYDLNREKATIKCPGVGVKGYIVLDFQKKHCVAWTETIGTRCCGYRNWSKCEEWYSSRQVVLASW